MTYQFTCEHCGEVFEKETKSRSRFCGKDCWEAGRGPLPGRSRDAVAGAMRASLKNQESGVKSAMLKHHREYACAVCGKPVDLKNGADLHHAIPVYVLFNTFLRERGITRPEVAAEQTRSIRHRRDRPFRFTDGEFASAWRRYHRFNRMLQVVIARVVMLRPIENLRLKTGPMLLKFRAVGTSAMMHESSIAPPRRPGSVPCSRRPLVAKKQVVRVRLGSLWQRRSNGDQVVIWTSHGSLVRVCPQTGGFWEFSREEFLRDYEPAKEAAGG